MQISHSNRRRRPAVAAAVALCVIAGAGSAAFGASNGAAGVAYAKQQLALYTKTQNTFTAPGPPIKGIKKKLNGTTVWYIPVFLQAPYFGADVSALAQPLALAGAKLHVCDAAANPSTATSCINQAVAAHASGIITDAMNDSFASQAYAAAVAAHIPVVATDNDNAAGFPQSPDLVTVSHSLPKSAALGADWIIADSKGKANVLYAADSSNDGTIEGAAVRAEFKKYCPGCKVTVVTFGDLTVSQLSTSVSSAMTSNPSINYVYAAYDAPAGAIALQGANTVGGRSFKFVAFTGQPPGLERVAAGQQAVDPGNDNNNAMWNTADALFRIVSGAKHVHYKTAVRLFTKGNLPSNLTDVTAYGSGKWYGNNSYQGMYKKLWGLG